MQLDPNISKSAIADLEQATLEIISEKDFQPQNPEALAIWLNQNGDAIARRASDLQQTFVVKILEHQTSIAPALSAIVWGEINKKAIDESVNHTIDELRG